MITKIKIEKVLDEIRPMLQMHGGDIELIKIEPKKKVVTVRLSGGCSGCPMAGATLKNLVEVKLKNNLPEIKSVESV